jgi:glycosyltransferase involved in cell wall biosynthesis
VVIPARNEALNVDYTLESLFAQTRLPDEIVLADACSADETVERFLRHRHRRIPLTVTRNESLFAGGGRNAGTRAAAHDIIVFMDLGNRAERDWLEAMARPFEEDPELDFLGGLHLPISDTPFRRVCTAVLEHHRRGMDKEQIRALITDQVVPGGMCMAYRRRILKRVGGFSEWARKGQDRLFGYKVRRMGGKVSITLDAKVHHKMPRSFRQLWARHYLYELWVSRIGLPRSNLGKLVAIYGAGLAVLAASIVFPWLLLPAAVLLILYLNLRVWRKLALFQADGEERFRLRDRLLGVAVLFTSEAAVVLGGVLGLLDRLVRPSWRRRTKSYLEGSP